MTKTSRFNYIKRGLVGVCAATMLTGLCAGTAFGATGDPMETPVKIAGDAGGFQISATVPSAIPVSFNESGAFVSPTEAKFSNTGDHISLAVTGATISASPKVALVAKDGSLGTDEMWMTVASGTDASAKTWDLSKAWTANETWKIDDTNGLTLSVAGNVGRLTKGVYAVGSESTLFTITWTIGQA